MKIKVVWICHFSNAQIRERLKFRKWSLSSVMRRLCNKKVLYDFAVWNTNAIREFEKFEDVELHIISPHTGISGVQHFKKNGVFYCFFRHENDNFVSILKSRIAKITKKGYYINSRIINRELERIQPDIIHLIGAENPDYSESVLSLSLDKPLVVSLQTLMCDPNFLGNYPIGIDEYNYRKSVEVKILSNADYIATKIGHFRSIIKTIREDAKFLDMELALGEEALTSVESVKTYDFVYFAANISKAVDYAIEAFALAKRKHDNITLHVIGDYDDSLMAEIKQQLERIGILEGIDFTGKLPTYNDVINEIRKARFALIPLKVDMISGTVRESMANGLPVITTITPLTPELNSRRDSVLLSEKGDFQTMADNMCRLIEDDMLVETLKENGYLTVREMYDNNHAMKVWKNYYELIVKSK